MEPAEGMLIKVTKDGPYLVSGSVSLCKQTILADEQGESVEWEQDACFDDHQKCGLCRCGKSERKPFCDGSHMDVAFDGTETAVRAPYAQLAEEIVGPILTLCDAPDLCVEARFCHRAGGAWNLVHSEAPDTLATVIDEIAKCPSGRYVVKETATGEVIEPHLPPSIGIVQDPPQNCSGPLWVRGGIEIQSADGESYEVRNRVTLCRCGESKNKPLCDGSHAECGFRDGL